MATDQTTRTHPTAPANQAAEPVPAPVARRATQRGGLNCDQIFQAALRIVDAEGLDALTMRRLGQALTCDPMTLYRYTRNRETLLEGVAELVWSQLVISTDTADWQTQLRRSAHDFRRVALTHPHVVPLLVTRPLATPLGLRPLGTLRPLEQILELLITVGFAPEDALRVYRTYIGFLYGHILNELQELVVNPDETDDLLRLGLHHLPPRQFPLVRSLAGAFAAYDGATEFNHGLDVLIAGLQAHLHPEPEPRWRSGREPSHDQMSDGVAVD